MKKIFIIVIVIVFVLGGCRNDQLNNDENTPNEVENDLEDEENIIENEDDKEKDKIMDDDEENKTKKDDEQKKEEDETQNDNDNPADESGSIQDDEDNAINADMNIEKYMWVTAEEGLNLREFPQINSDKIDLIPYGAEVIIKNNKKVNDTVGKTKGNWINIVYNDREGWAFDAYLQNIIGSDDSVQADNEIVNNEIADNVIDRSSIKTGDIVNGLVARVNRDEDSTISQINIEFTGKIFLTGELVRNKVGASLIPDKEYSDLFPVLAGGNEIFYINLENFKYKETEYDLHKDVQKVEVEIDKYTINSSIRGENEVPCYSAKIVNMSESLTDGITGYEGQVFEDCIITNDLQLKDTICGVKVVDRYIYNDSYNSEESYYTGRVEFEGEIVVKANYYYTDGDFHTGYIFDISEEYSDKIPHFKNHENPSFIVRSSDESLKDTLGSKGEAMVILSNYNYYYMPEDIVSTAEISQILSADKERDFIIESN